MSNSNESNSFRDLENNLRKKSLQNNVDELSFLDALNDLLLENPLALNQDSNLVYPSIFVLGVPRSGTTLLMQLLASGLDVGYPDCIIARFWKAPQYGCLLSKHLVGNKNKITFNSKYGTPDNIFEPHEFSYFWHYWMNAGTIDNEKQTACSAHNIDWDGFKNQLGAMQTCFAKPIAMKGLLAKGVLNELSVKIPKTVYLYIERDKVDVALSLLEARKRYYGTESQWWSMYPDNYSALRSLRPMEQVAGQAIMLDQEFRKELKNVSNAEVIYIKYRELCENPDGVINRIKKDVVNAYEFLLKLKSIKHEPFVLQKKAIPQGRYNEVKEAFKMFDYDIEKEKVDFQIPYKKVLIPVDGVVKVNKLLNEGQLVTGKKVAVLEDEIAEYLGGNVEVACVSSGMAALEMILTVLGGNQRKVSIPSFSCEALALAVERAGCSLELLDVDYDTMNLTCGTCVDDIVVVPHMFGMPAPIKSIKALVTIEDCAHSFGAMLDNKLCGTLGDYSFFSFYATKILSGIHGGAIVSKNKDFINEMRDLRQYNHRQSYKKRFQYPMSDISAEIVLSNLAHYEEYKRQRLKLAKTYDQALKYFPINRQTGIKGAAPVFDQYVVSANESQTIIEICKQHHISVSRVLPEGIATRKHLQELENTKKLSKSAIGLPLYIGMKDEEQTYIINTISKAWK